MTIFIGSRYEYEPVDRVLGADGEYHAAIFRTPQAAFPDFSFQPYIVEEGDRLDLLAAHFYDDSEKWWMICEANPERFDFTLIPGEVLRIPYATPRS